MNFKSVSHRMRSRLAMAVLLPALMVLVNVSRVDAAVMLYAITFDDELLTIDPLTGAGTLVGNLDSSMGAFGLGTRGGLLYAFDQTADVIRQLDPGTADTLASTNVGIVTVGEGGMAFRSDGLGFLGQGGAGGFWSFDIPGASSVALPNTNPTFDGLDFSANDTLYGISQQTAGGASSLYTINTTTGATALIGSTGVSPVVNLAGLAFRFDDALFAVWDGILYSVNTSTGLATRIGPVGFNNISGLTFLDVAAVPEPATLLLLGSGLSALAYRRRRRQN